MTPTEEMVRVAAEAICEALFGPFDLAELAHPSSSSAQSVIAAEAALSAALAAMWQPSLKTAPRDRQFLVAMRDPKELREAIHYHVAKYIGAEKKSLVIGHAFSFDHTDEIVAWAEINEIEPPAPTLLSTRMGD